MIYGIHQTLTLFGLCLGLVHALASPAVPRGPVRVVDEWLPFTNPHDLMGIGIGVIALELFLALALSALVQGRLGYHRWRSLHRAAYVAFTLLTGHVLVSGSDVGAPSVTGAISGRWR
jgi:DMSO/TMAO reductase YedYZ heme-binding membrane subunit